MKYFVAIIILMAAFFALYAIDFDITPIPVILVDILVSLVCFWAFYTLIGL